LLGPSGCGKTTTLRMIAGFMTPTEGTISVGGQVISSPTAIVPPERRGMSMIFQSYAIWPNMTVRENVAFGLTLRKLNRTDIATRTDAMLAIVKLAHLADRYPAELSGGQQQRVALARAIVIEPDVLLLDEPLSNLDASLREEMRSEIRRLHDEFRITTVYVTHDQSEAMVTSDRIAVMNAGRIEQVADPVSLYTKPQTRFVAGFIGRTNLLDGVLDGADIRFPGFSVPAQGSFERRPSFSVRPQSIGLHRAAPAGPGRAWWVEGRVAERVYLGEHWDYLVAPAQGGPGLRVSTVPSIRHEVGEQVWLEIDPAMAAPIPPP
ncbi:MAG: ABC transporter ATP-binding protein, partial [Pseudomonadota bacterium]|nr:ABC transporter ATP-binding protein [Pseudomonadota bacterium]